MSEQDQLRDDEDILNYYVSQREDIINKMESEKQKEQHAKLFMEEQLKMLKEKIKICYDLDKEYESIKEKSEKETKLENELVKKLTSTNEIMTNNVENFHLLRNLLQLCLNDQNQWDELKQSILDSFEKIKRKNNTKENEYVQKLSKMSEYLDSCKRQHSKNIEYFNTKRKTNQENISNVKLNIKNIQNQRKQNNQYIDELTQDTKNLTEELNSTYNKFSELQLMCKDFNEQKNKEELEYSKKISDLNSNSANIKDEILKLEIELKDVQNAFDYQTQFVIQLKNQKISTEETISNLKITETEKEINDLNEQLQKECEDDSKINSLKKQIEELKKNNILSGEDYTALQKEFSEINIEDNDLNTAMNDFEIYSKQLKSELKQEQEILEEQFDKFESEITTLKKQLNKEDQDEISNKDQQEIQSKLDELNEDYAVVNLQNDAISAEAEVDEITINANIDSVKNEINKIKPEIQEKQIEIKKCISDEKEKIGQLELEFEENMTKINLVFKNTKNELHECYQNKQKIKSDELKKIKENNTNLELYISELKVCTENLRSELELKNNELQKLQKDLNKNVVIETELNENTIDNTKETYNLKIPKNDFKIPKNKIPLSKYSSTSDSSSDEQAVVKKRRISFKQRRTAVPSQKIIGKDSQKSMDDIFEALKHGSGSVNKPTRKRSIKKPVF